MITEEEDTIYKKWFLAKPLIDKFAPAGYRSPEAMNLANTLGVQCTRIRSLCEPGAMLSATTADRYAVKLRISSRQHMG